MVALVAAVVVPINGRVRDLDSSQARWLEVTFNEGRAALNFRWRSCWISRPKEVCGHRVLQLSLPVHSFPGDGRVHAGGFRG